MNKILLTGYYGFDNIGDEAVLAQVIRQIKSVLPDCTISALSNAPEATTAQHGIVAFNRWKIVQTWSALRRHDIMVLGGGSLLQDVTGSRSLSFYLMQIKLARMAGRPVMLYAQGVGPILEAKNRRRLGKTVNKCALVTVRDHESAVLLQECGVDPDKIIVTLDPVLAAAPARTVIPGGKKIGLALRPWDSLNQPRLQAIAKVADQLTVAGYQIKLLPFYEPADREIAQQLQTLMKQQACLPEIPFDYHSMLAAIGELDMVLGMRLHSLVMAATMGTPFVGLSYDPKVESFCRSLAQPLMMVEQLTADNLQSLCSTTLEQQAAIRQSLVAQHARWQVTARANAVLLKQLLQQRPLDTAAAYEEAERLNN